MADYNQQVNQNSILARFQPTDFDLFLDEIGLADVTGDDRIDLVNIAKTSIEKEIVFTIFSRLEPFKKEQLARLMEDASVANSEQAVNDFLLIEIPDIEALVDLSIDKVKNTLRQFSTTLRQDIEADTLDALDAKKLSYKKADLTAPAVDKDENEEPLSMPNEKNEPDDLNNETLQPQIDPIDQAMAQINSVPTSNQPDQTVNTSTNPFPWEVSASSSQAINDELEAIK